MIIARCSKCGNVFVDDGWNKTGCTCPDKYDVEKQALGIKNKKESIKETK
jgi:exosome complex RNA-binding protein Csl4